jgi:hypothetical protein
MFREAIDTKSFLSVINSISRSVRELGWIPDLEEAGWSPLRDGKFWNELNEIKRLGLLGTGKGADYLIAFTQVDDLGPMGCALFLSKAALAALATIPQAAYDAILPVLNSFDCNTSGYRLIGALYVLQVCGNFTSDVEPFLEDNNGRMRTKVAYIMQAMQKGELPFSIQSLSE